MNLIKNHKWESRQRGISKEAYECIIRRCTFGEVYIVDKYEDFTSYGRANMRFYEWEEENMATIFKTEVIINDKEDSTIHFSPEFNTIESILINDVTFTLGNYMVDRVEHTITFRENIPKGAEIRVLYTVEDKNAKKIVFKNEEYIKTIGTMNYISNDKIYIIPTAYGKPVKVVFEEKERNEMDAYLSSGWKKEYECKWLPNSLMASKLPTITISNDFIKDVKVIVENKVVEVTFKDDEKIKTICDESDTFSLENAISIAIMKKLLGGTGAYNKAIKNGMKAYENRIESEQKKAEEEKKIAEKKAKAKIKRERRAARKKETHIQEQAEIMARAMKMVKEV